MISLASGETLQIKTNLSLPSKNCVYAYVNKMSHCTCTVSHCHKHYKQSATRTKSEIKCSYTYLVFSIFKNCKISENCINLKALKNLKPVRKKKDHKEISIYEQQKFRQHQQRSTVKNIIPFILSSMLTSFIGFILIMKKINSNWSSGTKHLLYQQNILEYMGKKKKKKMKMNTTSQVSLLQPTTLCFNLSSPAKHRHLPESCFIAAGSNSEHGRDENLD